MIRISLTLIIGLFSFFILSAQTYERAFNINTSDSGFITTSSLQADGSLFTGSIENQVQSSSSRTVPGNPSFGELVIRKLSNRHAEIWSYKIAGSIAVSMHMQTLENGNLIVSGAFIDSLTIPNDTTLYATPYSANAFILCLDTYGALLWIKCPRPHANGSTYFKVFDIYENKIFLPYIHFDNFNRSMKVKVLDDNGDSINNYELADQAILISGFKMDEDGNTYIAGTGSGRTKIGGADLGGDTTFGYAVYFAKLNQDFNQIWSKENNYITFDFFPKIAFTKDRVALITDTMPQQNGIGNHHLLKIFNTNGERLYTDSVGPSYFSRMHNFVDLMAINKGFIYATLYGFNGVEIRYIDRDFETSKLADAKYTATSSYVGFVANDSLIYYIHNYTESSLVVNSSDTLLNPKTNVGWNGYQQAVLSFSYENTLLSTPNLVQPSTVLYPNPAQSQLTLLVNASEIGNTVKIFSISGQLIQEIILESTETHLDISNYSSGLYLISNGVWHNRFVKE
jgi:hypothetical protein